MEILTEEKFPFSRFPDTASMEWFHEFWNNKFCFEIGFIILKLEEKVLDFYAPLMDFRQDPLTKDLSYTHINTERYFYAILSTTH